MTLKPFVVYDGYASGYKREGVLERARRVADFIRTWKMDELRTPTVVVHGNSGVSIGFAALAMEEFNLVLLRKDNDNSHGSPVEGPNGHVFEDYIILDDFVATGETVRRIVDKMHSLANAKGAVVPKCIGTMLYNSEGRNRVTTEDGPIENLLGVNHGTD